MFVTGNLNNNNQYYKSLLNTNPIIYTYYNLTNNPLYLYNNINSHGNVYNNNNQKIIHTLTYNIDSNGIIQSFKNMYNYLYTHNTPAKTNNWINMNKQNNAIINNLMNVDSINRETVNNYLNKKINNDENVQKIDNYNSVQNYYDYVLNAQRYNQIYGTINTVNKTFNTNVKNPTQGILKNPLNYGVNGSLNGKTINIMFETPNGKKITVPCNPNITIRELLRKYVQKVGIAESAINNSIYFLFNSCRLDNNGIETLEQKSLRDCSIITVIDQSSVLGA